MKKIVVIPEEQRLLFKDTHEAIIDAETFETVQRIRKSKRRPNKLGELGMFSGLVECADCAKKHRHLRGKGIDTNIESYVCGTYHSHKKPCTPHSIRVVILKKIVLEHMKRSFFCKRVRR